MQIAPSASEIFMHQSSSPSHTRVRILLIASESEASNWHVYGQIEWGLDRQSLSFIQLGALFVLHWIWPRLVWVIFRAHVHVLTEHNRLNIKLRLRVRASVRAYLRAQGVRDARRLSLLPRQDFCSVARRADKWATPFRYRGKRHVVQEESHFSRDLASLRNALKTACVCVFAFSWDARPPGHPLPFANSVRDYHGGHAASDAGPLTHSDAAKDKASPACRNAQTDLYELPHPLWSLFFSVQHAPLTQHCASGRDRIFSFRRSRSLNWKFKNLFAWE